MMKSLRLHGQHDLRLHDEPLPVPAQGEVLLRVTAIGICGSDLHWFAEQGIGDARLDTPLVLGHEFAAEIAEGPRKGQRVAVDPAVPCATCEWCEAGHPNLCPTVRFAGHGREDGALREFMAWPERVLFPLPDALSDADGAMLEPLGVAIHTVDLAHIKAGMTVGVFGCGPIGLLIMQVARAAGAATIIATDALPNRVQAAQALGANYAFLAQPDRSELGEVLAAAGKHGIDVAIEAAGSNAAVEVAIDALRPGGTLVLAGIPDDDRTAFNASTARRKGLTIKLVRRMKRTYPRAIRLVEAGRVDIRSIVTHTYPLTEANQAFDTALQRQGLKVVINP